MIELVEIAVQAAIIYSDDRKKRSQVEPTNQQSQNNANTNMIMVQPANNSQPDSNLIVAIDPKVSFFNITSS